MAHQLCFSFPCPLFFSLELLAFPSVALGSSLAVTFSFTSRKLSSPGRAQNESLHPGVLMWEWKHSITEVLSLLWLLMYTQKLSHHQRCSALANRVLPSVLWDVEICAEKIIASNGRVVLGPLEDDYGWSCTLIDLVPWEVASVKQDHLGSVSSRGDVRCCHLLPRSPRMNPGSGMPWTPAWVFSSNGICS